MALRGKHVAVVGGGIGGVAVATALAQRGAQVCVFEQAPELREVGAGLQISANGQRVLRALGVVGQKPPLGVTVSEGTEFRDGPTDRRVARIPAPQVGATWYMHRADLLALLVQGARDAGVEIELNRFVQPGALQSDVIIAADGVKSAWRNHVDGPDAPQFTGQVAWRAVIPHNASSNATRAVLSMGHRAHVVSYPLRGGTSMNLVAVEERRDWTEESWSRTGDLAEFRNRFARFGGSVGQLIAAAPQVHKWALHARPVARRWTKDNIVLLGDAAHPTLPFMAQGACLALEDAWVLSECLSHQTDLSVALRHYQTRRADRAARIVALASGNSWRFHMGKPWAWGAQAVLALGAGQIGKRLEWIYDYDATRSATQGGPPH